MITTNQVTQNLMPYSTIKMLSTLAAYLVATSLFMSATTTATTTATSASGGSDNLHKKSLFLPPDIDPTKLSYKLSFLWPQGYCKTKSSGCERATNLPSHFTMHGFWPIYRGKCEDSIEEFSIDKVSNIKDDLDRNWPDLKNYEKPENYDKFWDHEWIAHGTKCALYSVSDYFEHSLTLLADSNVLHILEEAGKPTKPEDVKKAFPGKEPYVLCKKGRNEKSYFFQLEFCLNGLQEYINCDPTKIQKTHCSEGEEFSYGDTTGTLFLKDLEKFIDQSLSV